MNKQIKTEDILQIQAGERKVFRCRDVKHCESVKSLSYRAAKVYPQLGVRFKCKVDYKASTVTIEAIAMEQPASELQY